MKNKHDYLSVSRVDFAYLCVSNRYRNCEIYLLFPCPATGTSRDSGGPTAQVSLERGRRRKWQEVLFRPPQREGRAPSRAHRETQGTGTGSATQKTVAGPGFLPSSGRIPAVVSKLSTGEEFQRHGDEDSTCSVAHERAIFFAPLILFF